MQHIDQIIPPALLEEMLAKRYISAQKHPTLPLSILNYTHECQFDRMWNEATEQCRGLIIDNMGWVVARPFRKFFNLNTEWRPETNLESLPPYGAEVSEKMDGSLGILWQYKGEIGVATRGSFTSDQAQWATKWVYSGNLAKFYELFALGDWTWLFEIISNKFAQEHVIQYDYEDLVMLGAVNNGTGEEMSCKWLEGIAKISNFRRPEIHWNVATLAVPQINPHPDRMEEGYVLCFQRPGTYPLRIKCKFEEYMQLHRIVTGLNEVAIWEMLRDHKQLELRSQTVHTHKKFQEWVNGVVHELEKKFNYLDQVTRHVYKYTLSGEECKAWTRREVAEAFKGWPLLTSMLFDLYDSKDIEAEIWKRIRPRGDKPKPVIDPDEA